MTYANIYFFNRKRSFFWIRMGLMLQGYLSLRYASWSVATFLNYARVAPCMPITWIGIILNEDALSFCLIDHFK